MLFNAFFKALAFAALAIAIPLSPNPAESVKKTLERRDSACSDSTFIGLTHGYSAFRADCHALRGKIRDKHMMYYPNPATDGDWNYGWSHQDWQVGTCRFWITKVGNVRLHSDDVADLVRDSVTQFSRYVNNVDRVESKGSIFCDDTLAGWIPQRLQWAVYRTERGEPPLRLWFPNEP